ncbi:MAG: ACT domain-containing protein [Betaproteobacteria bacterium]|nr:ACT domain-containing protein [Betaproteobacteria bacterium]
MAVIIRKADYFSMLVPNRAGSGANLLAALRAAGVNLLAFSGFPERGGAQVDFVPEDTKKFLAAAKMASLNVGARKTVFLMQGDDRVGVLAEVLGKIAEARISVVSMQAVCSGKGRYGAMFWVRKKDLVRVSRLLRVR